MKTKTLQNKHKFLNTTTTTAPLRQFYFYITDGDGLVRRKHQAGISHKMKEFELYEFSLYFQL